MRKPIIGITMGDPAGIGPEIIAKALRRPRIFSFCRPVVFGSLQSLRKVQPKELQFESVADFVDIKTSGSIRPGKQSLTSGKAALAYLDRAIEYALRGEIDAIVTAPLSKAAVQMTGRKDFTGHTEYLAKKTKSRSVTMMFYSRRLIVSLVTTHLPLRLVAKSITKERILDTILLTSGAVERLGKARPRIGVAGLNPHAGEQGTLGNEDHEIVGPAVKAAMRKGMRVDGPLPADVLFRKAYEGEFDVVIAMYHDQALVPFKMIAFEYGVNVTLGLPFVRTSVDHGTAFDIAGRGIASEKSLVEAIRLAVRLAR